MKIGIVGTGNIGANLARLFVKAGHQVILSWSRSPEKLIRLSLELGNHQTAKAGSVLEAVQDVDLTILAIRFSIMDEVRAQMGDITNKIIVDTNNPFDIKLPEGVTAAEEVNKRFPGIRLVKAFNTLYYESLLSESFSDPLTVLPVCSNDIEAKETISSLITEIGFVPLDIGRLDRVHIQEPNGELYNKSLSLENANAILQKILSA